MAGMTNPVKKRSGSGIVSYLIIAAVLIPFAGAAAIMWAALRH